MQATSSAPRSSSYGWRTVERRAPSSSPETSAATARRSCAIRHRSPTPSTSWSSRPTATASTTRTTRRSRSWSLPSRSRPPTGAYCSSRRSPSAAPRSSSGFSTTWCGNSASRGCRSISTRRWRPMPRVSIGTIPRRTTRTPPRCCVQATRRSNTRGSSSPTPWINRRRSAMPSGRSWSSPRPGIITGSQDHAPPQGLPSGPGLHAAVHRLPGRGDAWAAPPGRWQDRAHRWTEIDVRCRVRSISGFSAHADQHELEAWLGHFAADTKPKTVYIVHGDPDAAEAFAGRIRSDLKMDAVVAKHRQTVALT